MLTRLALVPTTEAVRPMVAGEAAGLVEAKEAAADREDTNAVDLLS